MNAFTKIKFDPQILDKLQEEERKFLLESSNFIPEMSADEAKIIWEEGELKYKLANDQPMLPMSFDLKSAINYHAKQNYRLKNEPLARACMLDRGSQNIFDITAGTGKDLMLLNAFGANLTAFERHPLIYLLLASSLKAIESSIEIHFLDAINLKRFCEENEVYPDVIYFDPMYPDKKKSALPRKEMQIFKALNLNDSDEEAVLEVALKVALKRVVVKRPIKGSKLKVPTASIMGSTTRYDIYQIN